MTSVEVSNYLNRISYSDRLSVNITTLGHLQEAHLLAVPFENLDIHYGRKIELDPHQFYQKIVEYGRGGFCYELNELFGQLLSSLGFNIKRISARVYDDQKGYGSEYDHLALIVRLGDRDYLVDVGFGAFAASPLEVNLGQTVDDAGGQFIFDDYNDGYFRINKMENNKWIPQYIFQPIHRELSEYQARCNYHQTSDRSHFTRKKLISLMTPNGRITLTDEKLKIQTATDLRETEIKNEVEFTTSLKRYFSIDVIPNKQ